MRASQRRGARPKEAGAAPSGTLRKARRAPSKHPEWYAARCVFRHEGLRPNRGKRFVYEERIVILAATSADDAIRKAVSEAKGYEKAVGGAKYLKFVETYHLFDSTLRSGTEVFSLLRSSSRGAPSFITRYLDDGSEHRQR